MSSEDKMLERVRKLIAQAESVAGTPEADVFYAKAFDLMAKHNIDEAMARQKPGADRGNGGDLMVTRFRFTGEYAYSRVKLAAYVAQALHCKAVVSETEAQVVGVRRNIERVKLLFPLLSVQMFAAGAKRVPEDDPWAALANRDAAGRRKAPASRQVIQDRKDFFDGFSMAVSYRIAEAERRAARDYDQNTGSGAELLLVSDLQRAQREFARRFPNVRYGHARETAGMRAGAEAGRNADIGQTRVGGGSRAIGR